MVSARCHRLEPMWADLTLASPDFAVMVRNATRGGRRAAYATGLGVTAGFMVHATAAAVGLGTLLAASATA